GVRGRDHRRLRQPARRGDRWARDRRAGLVRIRPRPGLLGSRRVPRLHRLRHDQADWNLRRADGEPRMRRQLYDLRWPLAVVILYALPYHLNDYSVHIADIIVIFAIMAI